MWLLIARASPPDAPNWFGRRALAALDALAWPLAWIVVVLQLPGHGAMVGTLSIAVACLTGVWRLQRALFRNRRYYFVTWRLGRILLPLILIGWILKLALVGS